MRPHEPGNCRDLALIEAKLKNYDEAVPLLQAIIERNWDPRFRYRKTKHMRIHFIPSNTLISLAPFIPFSGPESAGFPHRSVSQLMIDHPFFGLLSRS